MENKINVWNHQPDEVCKMLYTKTNAFFSWLAGMYEIPVEDWSITIWLFNIAMENHHV